MTNPKSGDVLTAEQARALPDGAVVDVSWTHTVGGNDNARNLGESIDNGFTVTLVSLPTPPDMAPGSVVLDEDGMAWVRYDHTSAWFRVQSGTWRTWSDLAPRVARVLHDAGAES